MKIYEDLKNLNEQSHVNIRLNNQKKFKSLCKLLLIILIPTLIMTVFLFLTFFNSSPSAPCTGPSGDCWNTRGFTGMLLFIDCFWLFALGLMFLIGYSQKDSSRRMAL